MSDDGLEDLVGLLDEATLRALTADAALRDVETARAVRLAAARPGERLTAIQVAELREAHHRRPSLMAMLDKAGFR